MRILSGVTLGGITPIALAVIADIYPFEKLGRAMGWMFGAIAGGMAFGATLGAWLNPSLGWRNEFLLLSVANACVFAYIWRFRHLLSGPSETPTLLKHLLKGYVSLLKTSRGFRTYSFIFMNGFFHGGVFAWLGFYLSQRYHLGDEGIGKALLGYGIPGMFLGPLLGRLADRFGRSKIIPVGFVLASFCALGLIPNLPLWFITILVTCLSIGLHIPLR